MKIYSQKQDNPNLERVQQIIAGLHSQQLTVNSQSERRN
jgi:hypothetical protein